MFTQFRILVTRLSITAALLVTAAACAGWKWNRLSL
jgi:hypothetical protein